MSPIKARSIHAAKSSSPIDLAIEAASRDWSSLVNDHLRSSIAAFAEAVLARAKKLGGQAFWADASWTSVVGWAKYGSRMGLDPDKAAAFAITFG